MAKNIKVKGRNIVKNILLGMGVIFVSATAMHVLAAEVIINGVEVIDGVDGRGGNGHDEPYFMVFPDGDLRRGQCVTPGGLGSGDNPRNGLVRPPNWLPFAPTLITFDNYVRVDIWDADGRAYDCGVSWGSDDPVRAFNIDSTRGPYCQTVVAEQLGSVHKVCYTVE